MKTCTICNTTKELNEFGKKSKSPDGLYPQCKLCKSQKDKLNYELKKEHRIKSARLYYENNKEKVLARVTSEQNKARRRELWALNKDENNKRQQEKRKSQCNKYSERKKQYRKESRSKIQQTENKYYSENPVAKITKSIRNRLQDLFKQKSFLKTTRFGESVGCDLDFLKNHIESNWQDGMTWDNYGKVWNIDHLIPLSYAQNEQHVYELNHYLNLKPVYCFENFSKSNHRADICWQKFKRDKLMQEDIALGHNFSLTPSDFVFAEESITDEHRKFIERYEWLGTCGFGVRHVFTARHDGKLCGVVMMAEPNAYQFDKKYEALIQRGACASWAPKNLNSKLVMFACRWMVSNTEKRIFVAYSDPEAGEIGTIYQACNFDYLGQTFGSDHMYVLEDGRQVNSRYFTRTSSMKRWAKLLNIKWEKEWDKDNGFQDLSSIPEEVKTQLNDYANNLRDSLNKVKKKNKGKYVLLLNYGKEKLKKTWTPLPYPKRQ